MSTQAPSILLLRLSSLGDIVLTTPLVLALREQYPDARIDMVIAKEYESLMPAVSGLTDVHVFDKATGTAGLRSLHEKLKSQNYEYVLDLHNVPRTKILRRGLGKSVSVINKRTIKRWLLVKFKIDLLKSAPDVIGRYFETAAPLRIQDPGTGPKLQANAVRDRNRIAIAPGSRHWNKRWPAEYFIEVARQLTLEGFHIDIHGSDADRYISERIARELPPGSFDDHVGKLTLSQVANELGKASAIITNDSGLMHVAKAVGTRVIAIFGPTVKQFGFAPRDPSAIVLEVAGMQCRPCTAIGLDHCPKKHFRCMKGIEPEKVLHELKLMTSSSSPGMKA